MMTAVRGAEFNTASVAFSPLVSNLNTVKAYSVAAAISIAVIRYKAFPASCKVATAACILL